MDRYETRRARLRVLIDERFGGVAASLARAVGIDSTYVARMLYPPGKAGRKGIGEDSVAKIESALDLPRGWMDQDHALSAAAPAGARRRCPGWPNLPDELSNGNALLHRIIERLPAGID